MPSPADRLRAIKNFIDLVCYLEDELDWPFGEYDFDQLTFEYQPDELGLKESEAAKVKAIYQLRPLQADQPWGIFFVEFEKKRLPVVVLRRILSHLVVKKRAAAYQAHAAAWHLHDLLFITAFGEENFDQREIAFAHFHQDAGDLPTLRVLGWDGSDTPLKLDYVAATLKQRLCWPEDPTDAEAWRSQWSPAFRHRVGHVIRTADALAETLASMARRIRAATMQLLERESESGPLRQLYKAFQTALIHDLKEADFADTYAQTITYGLLTAAISRTEMSGGVYGTELIASNVTDMVPITNPFLREMLETFLQVGGRKGGINFDELGIQDVVDLLRGEETDLPAILRDFGNRAPGEDPVIHFYEHFLAAYDKKLKVKRGVFYTPKPVVSFIVRSVHELLQKEFGLEDGLASTITWGEMAQRNPGLQIPEGMPADSPFVVILDPATGTATFLVEVIDMIYHTMMGIYKQQDLTNTQRREAWNKYVSKHLLPRLYGYELMMAPYAIAHMKIGLKLYETGYRFDTTERARVYLTNALEAPSTLADQSAANMFEALGHEAQAVNEVKCNSHFTVVIGNPPYSGHSANASKNTDGSRNFIGNLLQDYYQVDNIPLGEKNPKWLQDDYVKFLRFGQWIISQTKIGILAMITNHGYLDNPTFRGMRWHLMKSFSVIYLLDLHGNTKKNETAPDGSKDENVFDIQQGVTISVMISGYKPSLYSDIFHANLYGTREFKYSQLVQQKLLGSIWNKLRPSRSFYLFIPQSNQIKAEYEKLWKITEIMPTNSPGIVTGQDGEAIAFNKSDAEFLAIKHKVSKDKIFRLLYRPFDYRYVVYDRKLVTRARSEVMRHMMTNHNLAMITVRKAPPQSMCNYFLVTRNLISNGAIRSDNQSIDTLFPLYTTNIRFDKQQSLFESYLGESNIISNVSKEFITEIQKQLGIVVKNNSLNQQFSTIRPEDVLYYMYAVFYSSTYRKRYAEFLKIDFPRVPLTSNLDLFRALCGSGGQLVALHLLESPALDKPITQFSGIGDNTVQCGYPKYQGGVVNINTAQGFECVPQAVWEFHIGGYQVCYKWLKDRRGRILSTDDISHYQRIVVALNETIRLMGEIDAVIEEHGGWPIK